MSAYNDAQTPGGYDGTEYGGIGEVSPVNAGAAPFSDSAFVQQGTSLAFGYLARRLDVDLQSRIAGSMPRPQQPGVAPRQAIGNRGAPQPQEPVKESGLSMGTLVLIAGAAAVAFALGS